MAKMQSSITLAAVLAGATLALGLVSTAPASAAPFGVAKMTGPAAVAEPVKIFRRGRPPVYPYYYNPGKPGGRSFYFGFVPYEKGNYEVQALQRKYPESNWPPSMRYWNPTDGM